MAQAGTASPEPAATIEGPTWRLTDLRGLAPGTLPVGPRAITARLQGGRINGFSGCNQYFGSYSLKQDQLIIAPLGSSRMACDEASMQVESAVLRALAGTFRPILKDDRLTLMSATGEAMLSFKAAPIPKLEGLRLNITGFNNGRQAVVSPLADTTLYISFSDGIVKGFGGCNTFRATYATTDGNRIVVGPVAATRRVCPEKAVMQQEQEFLAALKSTTTWTISAALLDMHRADGERTLMGNVD